MEAPSATTYSVGRRRPGANAGSRISHHYPGNAVRAGDDVRSSVTIEADELKSPLRFYFLRLVDDDGNLDYQYDGYEMGSGPLTREAAESVDLTPRELPRSTRVGSERR